MGESLGCRWSRELGQIPGRKPAGREGGLSALDSTRVALAASDLVSRRLTLTAWCTALILAAPLTAVASTSGADRSGPKPPNGTAKRIEPFASYQPQSTCRPAAKVGTQMFARRMLRYYGRGHHIAISVPCGPGTSEHYEGRAWDWGLDVRNSAERKTARTFLYWMLKRDRHGRVAANARRLGVMYVIWNRRIWSSYRHRDGWRRYTGDPHRDHIHVSLSWAGARGTTSYWTGQVR